MPKSNAQVFADFVSLATQQGYGTLYQRHPHRPVPINCVFVRFRYPDGARFTSAGIVQ